MGLLDLTDIKKLKSIGINMSMIPEYVGEIDGEDNYTLTLELTFNDEKYITGLLGTVFDLKQLLCNLFNAIFENPTKILK